jgi:uncharacterized membrane protein required for colicin V production
MITIPNSIFIYCDLGIIAILTLAVLMGYIKGFMLQLLNLVALFAILLVAYYLSPLLAKMIPLVSNNDLLFNLPFIGPLIKTSLNGIVWFVLLVLILWLALFLLKPLVKAIGKLPVIKFFNRTLGAVFGGLKGIIFLMILSILLKTSLFTNGAALVEYSALHYVNPITQMVMHGIYSRFDSLGLIEKLINKDDLDATEMASLEAYLVQIGVSDQAKLVVAKVVSRQDLSAAELVILADWLNDCGVSQANIDALIQRYQ